MGHLEIMPLCTLSQWCPNTDFTKVVLRFTVSSVNLFFVFQHKVIQVWFQNKRSKDKRDASYREVVRDEPSNQSTPVSTPPRYPQSPIISTSLSSTTASTPPVAPSPQGISTVSFINT